MQNNNTTKDSKNEAVESPPPPSPTAPKAKPSKPVKEDLDTKTPKSQEKKLVLEEVVENLAQEKGDFEKDADVKKPSKKSKKNKKKSQQSVENKAEGQSTAAATKGPGEGKKGKQEKGDAPAKELSQGDNKKTSESKKSDKKDAKKDGLTGTVGMDIITRLQKLEEENAQLKKIFEELKTVSSSLVNLSSRVEKLEQVCVKCCAPEKAMCGTPSEEPTSGCKPVEKKDEVDDDIDLFGSDEEDPEKEMIKAERLRMYEEKKSKKPTVVAKSNIILDVKPWDDETDMKAMESKVREISCDGLLWGASKLVPLAYGIHKLQISCVIEDDLVSVDWLQEQIEANEDLVQSVDIAAFNKV